MIGQFDVVAINPPIWTLVYEARLSLLFPLIYLAVTRGGRRTLVAVVTLWIVGIGYAAARELHYVPGTAIINTTLRTVHLAMTFFIGAMIAKHRFQIAGWMSTRRSPVVMAWLALSILVFMYSFGYSWEEWAPRSVLLVAESCTAVASAFFVALAISTPAPARGGMTGFFGTISYSLYLVHQPVIMATILLFYGKCSAPVMWPISIAGSVGLAWLFYLTVERPSKAASRAVRLSGLRSGVADGGLAKPTK